jgi:hypothetical protein
MLRNLRWELRNFVPHAPLEADTVRSLHEAKDLEAK